MIKKQTVFFPSKHDLEDYNLSEKTVERFVFTTEQLSKYVEIEKIKFAIEQIKRLSTMVDSSFFYSTKEGRKVEELEQKLKQLEDETK